MTAEGLVRPPVDSAPGRASPVFSLTDASVAIGGRTILHPTTLDIPSGRVVGLLGQNGSGKSTFLKMLARQMQPSTGTVRFEGRPLESFGNRDFAQRVAYLPQYPPTGTGLLARELVMLGRYPWHGALGRFSDEDAAKTREAMALTDTALFAERALDTLSGGERQRVWLAMLVAQDAGCILLDEPISALDIAHQLEVLTVIRDLSRDRGIGVLMVLHDVNMAARFCDEIVALKQGRLIASQSPAEFMTADGLRNVYDVAMTVIRDPESGLPLGFAR